MNALAVIRDFPMGVWEKAVPSRCLIERDEVLVEMCRGRRVLHIGAADAPFEADKAAGGELLHQKVGAVAATLVGVDIDRGAVERLEAFGINDIIVGDIADRNLLAGENYDVVLCCDVIEHVLSPGELISNCARFLGPQSDLIVTTVNGTALKPAARALFGREAVHHDHTCYFSYGTLCQLLVRCGYRPTAFGVFLYPTVTRLAGHISRFLVGRSTGLADGILVVARLGEAR